LERLFWWATLNVFELKDPARCASIASMTAHARQQKITFGEMRGSGVDRVLIYCADYRCSHSIEMSAAGWPDQLRVPTLSIGSSAPHAVSVAPISGLTFDRQKWARTDKICGRRVRASFHTGKFTGDERTKQNRRERVE